MADNPYLKSLHVLDENLLEAVSNAAKAHCYKLKSQGQLDFSEFFDPKTRSKRPFIYAPGETLTHAWEKACIAVLGLGSEAHTGYDRENKKGEYIDRPSREAKVVLEIQKPFDPRIHKNIPGGIEDNIKYAAEVIDGSNDHLKMPFEDLVEALRSGDSAQLKALDEKWKGKWKYTYHERLTAYPIIQPGTGEVMRINQFEQMLNKLKREPLSKSIEAITWVPLLDHNDGVIKYGDKTRALQEFRFEDYDSPCFQRWWYRLTPCDGPRGSGYRTDVDTDWRSRDLYKAVPMNDFAFMMWHLIFNEKVEKELSIPIYGGTHFDHSNSLHWYGAYIDPVHPDNAGGCKNNLENVMRMIHEPTEKRLWVPSEEMYKFQKESAVETRDMVRKEIQERGIDPIKLDYLGRENPLFPVVEAA